MFEKKALLMPVYCIYTRFYLCDSLSTIMQRKEDIWDQTESITARGTVSISVIVKPAACLILAFSVFSLRG